MKKSKQFFIGVVVALFFATGLCAFPSELCAADGGKPAFSSTNTGGVHVLALPGAQPGPVLPDVAGSAWLTLDDGSRDTDIGIGGTKELIWVNRFTPAADAFPLRITDVQVWFATLGEVSVGDQIIIVVYENTSGNTDPAVGSNWLYSYPTTVQALDAWNTFTLPTPVLMNGPGDVIVGVIGLKVPGTSYWPASIDQTTTQQRSWAGWWTASPPPNPPTLPPDNSWTLIDSAFPGNWMVRAYYTDAVPHPAPEPGGSGWCFIATVAFGSPLARQVEILREFRDKYLLTNALGQKFVAWYYENGPVAASFIQDKPLAKAAVQAALYPLIGFSFLLINGFMPFVMIGLLLATLLFFRFKSKKSSTT